LHAKKFDRYLVDLAIGSSDLLASFLISSHAEDYRDRKRFFYEDYPEFNGWLDEQETVEVQGIPLPPSVALFWGDAEAYKEQLNKFESDKEGLIRRLEDNIVDHNTIGKKQTKKERKELIRRLEESGSFRETHALIAELNEYAPYLTSDEILRLVLAKNKNNQISLIQTDADIATFYATIEQSQSIVNTAGIGFS